MEVDMAISYKKLWHILLDRDMDRKDLEKLAGVSHYTMTKMVLIRRLYLFQIKTTSEELMLRALEII